MYTGRYKIKVHGGKGATSYNLANSCIPEKYLDAGQRAGLAAEAAVKGIAVVKNRPLVLIYSIHFCSSIVFEVLVSNYLETRQKNNGRLY